MDPIANPYTPNAGAEPLAVVGRDDQLASFDLLLGRLRRGRPEQSMIITGLRGVGKTVLLGQFRRKALAADWVVVELEVSKHSDDQFRRDLASRLRSALFEIAPKSRWTDRVRRAAGVLKSFTLSVDATGQFQVGLDAEPIAGVADHQDLAMDVTDVLLEMGEAAQEHGKGVVLLLDEVQFLGARQLESVIEALHKCVQRRTPVTLVAAGLPQIAELTGDAKSYSERLFKFPEIGNLGAEDARRALQEPARDEGAEFQGDALDLALEVTGGYPFFLQELGSAVWATASSAPFSRQDVADALDGYRAKLDSSFFRVRLDRATEMQRIYLRAMAELGPEPQKAADVAHVMERESPQVAPTRAELINMGLLFTPEHGYAAFTVPHFDQFMLRAIPDLVVPPVRRRPRK